MVFDDGGVIVEGVDGGVNVTVDDAVDVDDGGDGRW